MRDHSYLATRLDFIETNLFGFEEKILKIIKKKLKQT